MQLSNYKKTSLYIVAGIVVALVALVSALVFYESAHAVNVLDQGCNAAGTKNAVCDAKSDDVPKMIGNVISILMYALGVAAVIAIIIGGIRYTTANGDAGQLKQAKDTIMYSVVGLIVAIMAGAIVTYVVNQFA